MQDKPKYNPYSKKNWPKSSLGFGVFMYVFIVLVLPYLSGEAITWRSLIVGIIACTIGGVGFGYTMHLYFRRFPNKKWENTDHPKKNH
ncbi:MAG TPA: hypothetical protein PLP06_03455 [Saprospiraceae bacterium]|nr:hypothetical protein [Saprospiraceae bacterium]